MILQNNRCITNYLDVQPDFVVYVLFDQQALPPLDQPG